MLVFRAKNRIRPKELFHNMGSYWLDPTRSTMLFQIGAILSLSKFIFAANFVYSPPWHGTIDTRVQQSTKGA